MGKKTLKSALGKRRKFQRTTEKEEGFERIKASNKDEGQSAIKRLKIE